MSPDSNWQQVGEATLVDRSLCQIEMAGRAAVSPDSNWQQVGEAISGRRHSALFLITD